MAFEDSSGADDPNERRLNARLSHSDWELVTQISRTLGAKSRLSSKEARQKLIQESIAELRAPNSTRTPKDVLKPVFDRMRIKRSKSLNVAISPEMETDFLNIWNHVNTFANQGETAVMLLLMAAIRRNGGAE